MKKKKFKTYTKAKKFSCDWTEKKELFKSLDDVDFYFGHDMVVDKFSEIIIFKQRKC